MAMSSTTTRKTTITDVACLRQALARIPGASYAGVRRERLYDGIERLGHSVHLPGWRYPVIVDQDTGELSYDNYKGNWGNAKELNQLLQEYAVATCENFSTSVGGELHRQNLPNGEIEISITMGSAEQPAGEPVSDLPV
jgi:hypothetical protein